MHATPAPGTLVTIAGEPYALRSRRSAEQVMFYRTGEPHGLRHNPFNALVVPRPIGWISSIDAEGTVNLAPYSFFNAVAYFPPQVMFSATAEHSEGGPKDSVANIAATGEFVVNLVSEPLKEAMNRTSTAAPRAIDEFDLAGLEKLPSEIVAPPRVAASKAHFECVLSQIVELESEGEGFNRMVVGKVVGVHIADEVIVDGMIDMQRLAPVSRLGYRDYALLGEIFAMDRPAWP